MTAFFNSNTFVALSTLLVGSVAFIVYKIQQKDFKKDAANAILLEMKSAERSLRVVKENINKDILAADTQVMHYESWSKHKYLFVRDLDRDEWDLITDFYAKCQLIDEAVKYNNSSFWNDVEQIRANKQRVLADITKEHIGIPEEKRNAAEFIKTAEDFDKIYMVRQGQFGYNPQKPINDVRLYLTNLNIQITQTTIGMKLKRLAKIR